jgi:dipeptidyl aminopeptidase/acylaminoacyl peptidase
VRTTVSGYTFLTITYRGSTTFGKRFEEQIWGDLGHWKVEDMVAARAWLVREGIARPDAIVLTSWSYGGYLALQALGAYPEL